MVCLVIFINEKMYLGSKKVEKHCLKEYDHSSKATGQIDTFPKQWTVVFKQFTPEQNILTLNKLKVIIAIVYLIFSCCYFMTYL